MARPRQPHPDQIPLALDRDAALESEIARRVAIRCEAEAVRWKFRLVVLETVMISALVAAAGSALGQSATTVARAAALVAASCFASGSLLLGLSIIGGRLLARIRHGRIA